MQSFLDGHYYREHINDLSIETVCKMFHVSTSGYYSWLGKTRDIASRKAKEERDRIVKDCMLKIVKNRHYVPGKRTFKLDLERSFELQVSLRRIRSLMKEMNLVANVPKKDPYKHQATHDHEYAAPAENLLNRRFYIGPRKVILTDITYMPFTFGQKVAYHCVFRDAFTKEPLGWKNSMKMSVEDLVRPAYNMMMEKHGSELNDPDIYIHSDQGSQYLSTTIQQLLKDDEFIQSVSGRGNSWDNSPMESFFATMKSALLGIVAMAMDFQTVSDLIDGYLIQYNEKDAQYDLAGLSPNEFYAYITTGVYPLDSYFGVDAKRLVSPAELVEQRRKRAKEATEKARKRAAEKKASGMSYTGKEPDKVILRDIRIIEREQKKWNKTKKTAELQCSFLDKLLAKAEAALQFVSNASQQVKIDLLDRQSWKKYTQLNYIYDMKGMF